ncbi:hypothetical protein EsH8_IV_000535 [Colletotrichum jinshuiense]
MTICLRPEHRQSYDFLTEQSRRRQGGGSVDRNVHFSNNGASQRTSRDRRREPFDDTKDNGANNESYYYNDKGENHWDDTRERDNE